MSDSITDFRSGNKWMVAALNKVIAYARGHGVNPAGIPGWSWTIDGWQPPRVKPSSLSDSSPWEISATDREEGIISVSAGTILKSSDSISAVLTRSNPDDTFTVDAGGYIAIKLDLSETFGVTEYEIVYGSSWFLPDDKPIEYTGTPAQVDFQVLARYYPLWKFVAESGDGTIPIKEGIHAQRIAPSEHLRLIMAYYQIATDDAMFLVPDFELAPRAS